MHTDQAYIGNHSQSNQASKRYKRPLIQKGRRKLSLFANDMSLYTENPKDSTKKLLGIIMNLVKFQKAIAPHSSTLAWKTPWTEEPGSLQSMGSLRIGHD